MRSLLFLLLIFRAVFVSAQTPVPFSESSRTLSYTENKGQLLDMQNKKRADILFYAESGGVGFYLMKDRICHVFSEYKPDHNADSALKHSPQSGMLSLYRMDLCFIGANPNARIIKESPSSDYTNYYLGHIPNGLEFVRSYGKITYKDIYPNIDLVIYSLNAQMKYDFVVRPGGKVSDIQMKYEGAENTTLDEKAELIARTPLGWTKEDQPIAFEEGGRRICCRYVLEGNTIRFAAESYNPDKTMVIDPVREWATFYGKDGYNESTNVMTDDSDYVYVSGNTTSKTFPVTTGAYQTTFSGIYDGFIIKMDNKGNRKWTTYLGGSDDDRDLFTVTDHGQAEVVMGYTQSNNFPATSNSYQPTFKGNRDLFLFRMNTLGQRVWATYLGGNRAEYTGGICIDDSSNIIVIGTCDGANFPVTANAQQPNNDLYSDAILAKFDKFGSIKWSTYMGGAGKDFGIRVVSDKACNLYILGYTGSNKYYTPGVTYDQLAGIYNTYVAKLKGDGSLVWFSYSGGKTADFAHSLKINNADSTLYILGTCGYAFPFPTGAYQSKPYGIYLWKMTTSGNSLWRTSFTGTTVPADFVTEPSGLTLTKDGDPIFTGFYRQKDLPISNSLLDTPGYGTFIAKFTKYGKYVWSTYYGVGEPSRQYFIGALVEHYPICSDTSNNFYLVMANSPGSVLNQTTPGAFQYNSSGSDLYISKFKDFPIKCASNLTVTGATTTTISLKWNKGSGNRHMLIMKGISPVDRLPVSGVAYGVDSNYLNGLLGNRNLVVYNDTGSSCTLKGLPQGRTCYFALVESYVIGKSACYFKDTIPRTTGTTEYVFSDFTINQNEQCRAGNNYLFTNTTKWSKSTPNYLWHFGDGDSSTLKDPSHVYKKSGYYRVKLTTNVPQIDGRNDTTYTIHVMPTPNVSIIASDTILCNNNLLRLKKKISIDSGGYGSIWNLSTGYRTTADSFKIRLTKPGKYRISLAATSDLGCKDSAVMTVEVLPKLCIDFKINKQAQCLATNSFTFDFPAVTPDASNFRLSWNFGDGDTSNLAVPVHSYKKTGSYSVLLKAYYSNGMSDSMRKTVTVSETPTASFSMPAGTICASSPVSFKNSSKVSAGTLSYLWYFGDGDTSSQANPTHTYKQGKDYLVSLVAVTSAGCRDSAAQTITINGIPTASFKISDSLECLTGNSYSFTNLSTLNGIGYLKYRWDFGDGNTTNLANPVHSYKMAGNFTVRLLAFSDMGCKDSFRKNISVIDAPHASFSLNSTGQCLQGNSFIAISGSTGGMNNTVNWSFGDGVKATGDTVINTYTKTGIYRIRINVQSVLGCNDTFSRQVIVSDKPSTPVFTGRTIIRAGDTARYSILNPSSDYDYRWFVSGGTLKSSSQTDAVVSWSNGPMGKISLLAVDHECPSDTASLKVSLSTGVINTYEVFNDLRLFPNPANNKVNIQLESGRKEVMTIVVRDAIGKEVMTSLFSLQPGMNGLTMDMSSLARGIYFVNFSTRTNTKTVKLVLE